MPTREQILTVLQIQALKRWVSLLDSAAAKDWASKSTKAIRNTRRILLSKDFIDGADLTQLQLRELFDAMRVVVWNRALGLLTRTVRDRHRINQELRVRCHGTQPLEERINRFIRLPNVGPLTLSHFMCVLDPRRFPLISPLTLQVLGISHEQATQAEKRAIETFGIERPERLDQRTLTYLRDTEIFAEAKDASGVESYDALNRLLWFAREPEAENILFVNVGWTKFYDGSEPVEGDHAWIITHSQDPKQISEGQAFRSRADGMVTCGVGYGRVWQQGRTDVVFVARDPVTLDYKSVGIYFDPSFSYEDVGQPPREFGIAATNRYYLIPVMQRPIINWPRGRHMRRWAMAAGVTYWPDLLPIYRALLTASLEDEQETEELFNRYLHMMNPAIRRVIEDRAIFVTRQHFESLNAIVEEMPRNNPGYDLLITREASEDETKVEVKGTTDDGAEVLVTHTELKLLQSGEAILAVVCGIDLSANGDAYGGELTIYDRISDKLVNGTIQAIAMQYRLILP
jgi:hypothetical protein